jgi:diguanylate cyclase
MNNPTSDHLQPWKAKYAALVNELREYREKTDTREKLLCRIIIRLTLATSGLDPVIDPHLVHIRDLLRKGISNEQRLRELDTVSETLLREVKNKIGNDKFLKRESEGLFRFVKQLAVDDEERKAIALLDQGVDLGQITDWKRLFSELQAALRHDASVSTAAEVPKRGFWGRLLQTKKCPWGKRSNWARSVTSSLCCWAPSSCH